MTRARLAALIAIAIAIAGCNDLPEDHPSTVRGLRILAMSADPPDAQPGEGVSLDALVVDPRGGGRTITKTWSLCPALLAADVLDALTDPTVCLDDDAAIVLGGGDSRFLVVPEDWLDALRPGETSLDLPVLLEVSAGKERHAAVKRIRVSASAPDSVWPVIGPPQVLDASGNALTSVEWGRRAYLDADVSGSFNSVYWYVSHGRISEYDWGSEGPQKWILEGGSEPEHALVWGVTIAAGGTAWTMGDVDVE